MYALVVVVECFRPMHMMVLELIWLINRGCAQLMVALADSQGTACAVLLSIAWQSAARGK
jgi:hypothetical protein